MTLSSGRLLKRDVDNNRGALLPNAETIRTCRRARRRSTCLSTPRSVIAVESRCRRPSTMRFARTTSSRSTFMRTLARWQVFVEKAGKRGHRWWLWLFAGEDSVVFVLDPSRSHDVPQSHFPDDVRGVLMVDRYSGYKAMQQVKEGNLVLAFGWAHVRRDFVRVGKGYPELTAWALGWLRQIRKLYHLNRERLQHPVGTGEFTAADVELRQHVRAMAQQRDSELAGEGLRDPCRKALVSLNEHYSGLTLFVDDPRIPMDNNYGERLIRNPAVGRKNYYGSGSEWSGRLAMMLFSLFATLALWKINPRKWLNCYFDACAARLSPTLPDALRRPSPETMHSPTDSGTQTHAQLALDAAPILPPLRRIFT